RAVVERLLRTRFRSENFSMKSDVLKWPHHLWFKDGDPTWEGTMAWFLRAVDPHTIVFSNIGFRQPEANKEKAEHFVQQVLGRDVRVLWTKDDRTIKILTQRDGSLRGNLFVVDLSQD